jgi:hypothetical protein
VSELTTAAIILLSVAKLRLQMRAARSTGTSQIATKWNHQLTAFNVQLTGSHPWLSSTIVILPHVVVVLLGNWIE